MKVIPQLLHGSTWRAGFEDRPVNDKRIREVAVSPWTTVATRSIKARKTAYMLFNYLRKKPKRAPYKGICTYSLAVEEGLIDSRVERDPRFTLPPGCLLTSERNNTFVS